MKEEKVNKKEKQRKQENYLSNIFLKDYITI